MSRFVGILVGLTISTTVVFAQPPREQVVPPQAVPGSQVQPGVRVAPVPAGQVPVQDATGQPAQALRSKTILGARVALQGGTAAGTVEDIVFTEGGCIDYLVVANEGQYVMVPWDAARFNFGQRTAVIDITPQRYREIPTFTAERWPNVYEPTYRQKIYGYYGLTPGQERRLDRQDRRR